MTDQAYDDGSEAVIVTDVEEPPRGPWVDHEEAIVARPTDDEIEMGNLLGREIDPDDDNDAGEMVVQAIENLTS